MQILIDIDKERYNEIVNHYDTFPKQMRDYGVEAIRNGTVLPKGHGRLIDADALKDEWKEGFHKKIVDALMDEAPTVLDADKESAE